MSLLADLLSKTKQPQTRREVPPNLKNIVQQASKKSADKKKIILLSVVFFFSVAAGLITVRFVGSLEETVKERSVVTKADMTEQSDRPFEDSPRQPREAGESDDSPAVKGEKKPDPGAAAHTEEQPDIENLPVRHALGDNRGDKTPDSQTAVKKKQTVIASGSLPSPKEVSTKKETPLPERAEHVDKRDVYLYEAMEYEKQNDLVHALASYKKIVEIDRANLSAMNNIAYIYLQLDLPMQSITYSKMAVDIDNDYVPALINLGIAHGQLKDYGAAGEYLKRAAVLSPDDQTALINLAILYEGQGKYDEAAEYYARLHRYGSVEGLLGLARISEEQKKDEEALKYYQQAYALDSIDEGTRTRIKGRIAVLMNARGSRK